MRARIEPGGQRVLVGGGCLQAALLQQFEQGGDAQATIEVLVQEDFRQSPRRGLERFRSEVFHRVMLASTRDNTGGQHRGDSGPSLAILPATSTSSKG